MPRQPERRRRGAPVAAFPVDDYAPHGYLDNAAHSWRLGRSGVLRSIPSFGMAWHFPSYPGPYGRRWIYALALRPAFELEGQVVMEAADLDESGRRCRCPYHSKNLLRFECDGQSLAASADYVLASKDVLGLIVGLANRGNRPLRARFWLVAEYTRQLGLSGDWDFGLLARHDTGSRTARLAPFAEGTQFEIGADRVPSYSGCFTDAAAARDAMGARAAGRGAVAPATLSVRAPRGEIARVALALEYEVELSAGGRLDVPFSLARGESDVLIAATVRGRGSNVAAARRRAQHADARFWRDAPRLTGDWPAHWRRGWVYDSETLRSIVRPPRGIYRSPWDGMQVQVPRAVLAETMLDMLLLSYADPATARAVMAGVLEDAPAPNIPCTREDGSVNMVAEDGSACGTAPNWCYPFYCVALVLERTGDLDWLRRVYPRLRDYLDWWLTHRRGVTGWPHYKCGWESGQDESARFGIGHEGSGLIEQIRPVDLIASIAQAAALLARWAPLVDQPGDRARWESVAADFTARARSLWRDGWFHDFDGDRPTGQRDPMQLAPVICGVATPDQVEALRPRFGAMPAHGAWTAMEWPPVVFTILESAWLAGERELAARLAAETLERIWTTEDARTPAPGAPLPGVACEHWPPAGDWGTEGYGWGAMGVLLAVRHVLGIREEADRPGLSISPVLPPSLRARTGRYAISNYRYRDLRLEIAVDSRADGTGDVSVSCSGGPAHLEFDNKLPADADLVQPPARWPLGRSVTLHTDS